MAGSDMKVSGSGGVSAGGAVRGARPSSGGGAAFAPIGVGSAAETARPAASAGVSTVSSLEALMALQEVGGPLERRRRAAARGGRLLDALETIKIGMLEGTVSRSAVEALARDVREQRQATDDPRLDGVLAEIEMRAEVELAKLEQARVAA